MNKLSGSVWETDERERAVEQKTLQGNPNLANTPVLRWKGLHSTSRTAARSPLPLTLHLELMLVTGLSSSSNGFGGMPPPSRSSVLLYASHWPGAHFIPNTTTSCLWPYSITGFQMKPAPHSFPPPVTDTNTWGSSSCLRSYFVNSYEGIFALSQLPKQTN